MGHPEDVVLRLGEITVTRNAVITPAGTGPLNRTTWVAHDHVVTKQTTPAWAIVLAIIFFLFCLLGLLFLLAKETMVSGWVEVTVSGPGLHYATRIPVNSMIAIGYVHDQVNYAQSMAAGGGPGPARTQIPPGATVDHERRIWWDGTAWRPMP